ncbi:hypothetical protein [Luteibacter pinisoli]|uniref:hypothetical protein n=1 Tax=Luteibacter pinisoli TaxID=2589080 RepID=UPI001476B01F|nr:hypothetical protein [Luteibacter pinisoli]
MTQRSLTPKQPDPDIVFDVERVIELVKGSTLGFHPWVADRIVASYGAMANG